ncbi:hypothetical protein [Arthrobacter crystallopoietes]|uniref:hypothetical protein n=1 Tax=Crystallibacter crystallopoietes TaxID=37928 RepID=UPI0011113552|nr:hypothetical protein [Arthrobacter crystallopoietes]
MPELPPRGWLYELVFPYLLKALLVLVLVLISTGDIALAFLSAGAAVPLMAGVDEWTSRRQDRTIFRSRTAWGRTPLVDRLRQEDFGIGTLVPALLLMLIASEAEPDWSAALAWVFALTMAGISVWRIFEHRRVRKEGLTLPPMQLEWLQSVRVSKGHEEAVAELRRLYPKIGRIQADEIIERLP